MAQHKDLTGADLHEPKGVAGASVGTLYVANGSGSGTWRKVAASEVTVLDSAGKLAASDVEAALLELYQGMFTLQGKLDDVSNVSTILIPIPQSCVVAQIEMVLGGAITGADSTVTVTRSDGASLGTQTIAYSGSAEGTAFTFTPSGNNTLSYPTHRYLKIVTDGASSTTAPLYVTVKLQRN